MKTIGYCIIFIALTACTIASEEDKSSWSAPGYEFPYDLEKIDKEYKLPGKLVEVSGITFDANDDAWLVEDEQGILYRYSFKKEKVVEELAFAGPGDYEDLAIVDGKFWILRADGLLLQYDPNSDQTEVFDTPLSTVNDAEGLCLSPDRKNLWIACKEEAGIGKALPGKRAIYPFRLNNQELQPRKAVMLAVETFPELDVPTFKPSAIAYSPAGNLYVLAHDGKLLLVLSPEGKPLHWQKLSKKDFPQPEGMTFRQDGTLYISNEGRPGPGKIAKFEVN